ncbi:MAG: hypothetical protein DDT23_01361 [candidate division WS2 bacterium]|nr:hypothetical protein [Candidatus Lithacetigena glycinireducens]
MPTTPIATAIENEIFSYETFLTARASAGTATLTVQSILNFATNRILLIGELGSENAEIIRTHALTAPSGSTITLASNLVFTHPVYTKVRIMLYDQIEFSHATTKTGAKTVIATRPIEADNLATRHDDSTFSSGFYFTRYRNSITNTFSDYSDPIPWAGFKANTVSMVVNYALGRNKLDSFTDNITYQFCLEEINACLQFITGKLKGWSKLLKLNHVLGQTVRGSFKFTLPTDIWENRGIKSILGVRIGTALGLKSKIWSEFEDEMEGVAVTQVRTQAVARQTTLAINNSFDFKDSGSVNVYIGGILHNITYTGVTRSATAGVLTGIPALGTGSITVTIPVNTYVWDGEREGKPDCFTIDSDGNLLIWPLPDASYNNLNVYIDYWTGPTEVDSDADELDVFRYDAVKHWLTWVIRSQLKNDGVRNLADGDYIQFSQILADYIRNELPVHRKKRQPKINTITY